MSDQDKTGGAKIRKQVERAVTEIQERPPALRGPFAIRDEVINHGSQTATDWAMDMRPNRRRQRADAIMHLVLKAVRPYLHPLCDEDDRIAEALQKAFAAAGADVVTDADREAAGLSPRDNKGWTAAELHALELYRLKLLHGASIAVRVPRRGPTGGTDGD